MYITQVFTRKTAVFFIIAIALVLFGVAINITLSIAASPCQNDTSKSIDERVRTCEIPARERAEFKAGEIVKKLTAGEFVQGDFRIEIVEVRTIDGGLEVFARAWDENGEQIGFGRDGTVDIERFRVFNPPVLVPDENGSILREWQERQADGTFVTKQRRLREDAREALLQVIAHNISVMKNVHDSKAIQRGKIGKTTSTFYSDADPENTSVDGQARRTVSNEAWSTIRSGAGNESTDAQVVPQWASTHRNFNDNGWAEIVRGFVLFDTSSISDNDTIDSATFSLYGADKQDNLADPGSVAIVNMAPASTTAVVNSDYEDNVNNTTRFASDMTISSWATTTYNDFSLNSTGLSNVSKTGVTKIGTRMDFDTDNNEPSGNGSNSGAWVSGYAADETGTTQDPKLVVEHSDVTAPVISNVQDSGITTSAATITWNTDELSDSTVVYNTTSPATTTPYSQVSDATDVTSHSINLTGLTASTTYYYVVVSADGVGNVSTSTESSFTTLAQELTFARKDANENKTQTTTLTTDNTLSLTLTASTSYIVTGVITASSSAVQPDLDFAFTVPTGSEIDLGFAAFSGGSTAESGWLTESGQEETVPLPANTAVVIYIDGTVEIGSTEGNINFQWAQNTSQIDPTTILKGSYLRAEKID